MKVFVSGSTGFLGKAVVRELVGRGHEVAGLVRDDNNRLLLEKLGGRGVPGNLLEEGPWMEEVNDSERVISLSTPISFDERTSLGSVDEYNEKHATGVANLIRAARHGSVKAVIVTYDSMCFGEKAGRMVDEPEAFNPTGFCRPIGYSFERIADAGLDAGIPLVDVFPARVYGAEDWFAHMAVRIGEGGWRMAGDGNNYMSVIYLDDLARAYADAAEKLASSETFALSDGNPCTQAEFTFYLADLLGRPHPEAGEYSRFAKEEGIMLAESLAVSSKVYGRRAAELLNFKPRYASYREGIIAALKAMGLEPVKLGRETAA